MPKKIQVENKTRPLTKPAQVGFCDSFLCRLRGLMFRPRLDKDDGLLLVEARDSRVETSIHMLFVPFDLAVFWVNSEMKVVDKVLAKSWRLAYLPKAPARFTLEVHPARMEDYQIGDTVEFKNV
ncbi:MAG: hypothetical protein Fur002_21640 [Anaerolineales bacterium]